jgi:hypothetical protein
MLAGPQMIDAVIRTRAIIHSRFRPADSDPIGF